MDRIMIIAGGNWQVPLVKKAKSLGYEVLNTNLYEDSPGFTYADFCEVSDVRNKEKNLEFARKYQVSGVLTDQSDIAVPTVAYVAEELGCPTIGSEMAELFTNKFRMREFCIRNGFACPEYRMCISIEDATDFFRRLGKKIVIKPVDSQSSRGVFTIDNIDDLMEKFPISQSYSSGQNAVLAERYISGTEFTIDGIAFDGIHHSLAISEKAHFAYNSNIASDLLFSYENEKFDYNMLRTEHDRLINATGLLFGLTHAEYKFEEGRFYLIEMAARGGGTKIASDIVPYMSGIDNYKILIDYAMGKRTGLKLELDVQESCKHRWAVLKFLDIESNGKKIISIDGINEIKELEGIRDFALEFSVGDVVSRAQDDRSRVGYYIAFANSKAEIEQIEERVHELLKITFEGDD